jgi:transcriptional regulator with XRE-family HTH domain
MGTLRRRQEPLEEFKIEPYLRIMGRAFRKKREALMRTADDPDHWSLEQVAAVVGLSRKALFHVESGTHAPSLQVLLHLARYLKVSPVVLWPNDPADPVLPVLQSVAALPPELQRVLPSDPGQLQDLQKFMALPPEIRTHFMRLINAAFRSCAAKS